MLQAITRRLKRGKRGISTVIVVMLSLVLVVIIVGNVVLWSYQMNQFDWERMQENLDILSASRATASSWFTAQSEFTIAQGTRTSGTYQDTKIVDGIHETFIENASEATEVFNPSAYNAIDGTTHISGTLENLHTNDGTYMVFRSYASGTSTSDFYPSSYALFGSTKTVSGSLADVQNDDSNYMTFRSYISATSNTSKTDAFAAYRDSTTSLDTPKERTWTGDNATWGSQSEMATSGNPVRYTRVAYCPKEQRSFEKIVVTLSDDGYLDAYVWNGTFWIATNDIGQVWSIAPSDARRPYDVAYESSSGEALLVYGTTVAGGANDLAYRTWSFSSGWSAEQYFDDTDHASQIEVTYVELAPDPNSDKIGMAYIDNTNSDANAIIWSGSSWRDFLEITGTVAITTEECTAIACESVSGAFMAVAGEGQFIRWARFTTSWSSVGILDINSGAAGDMNWLKLASSQNNRLMLTSVDSSNYLCTAVWDTNSMGNRQWDTVAYTLGYMTSSTSVTAMRFTAQASKSVTNILVYIQYAYASPAYRFGIETSTAAYLPSGTYVGGASNYAVAAPAATGWLNLTLPSPASLTSGTVYHVTVRYDSGTIGGSNYIALRGLGAYMNNFRPHENAMDPWLNTIFGSTIQNRDPIFVLRYDDTSYEATPYDTMSSHSIYGANWFSEKWVQNGAQTVLGVNIPLAKIGTPSDNLYIVLRDETDSQDVATITVSQTDITTTVQWYEKYFDAPVQLADGKTYRLIFRSPSSTSSNYFTCRSLSTGQSGTLTYDGTNSLYSASIDSGVSWIDTDTRDLTYIFLLSNSGTTGWVIHTPQGTVSTNAQRCADFAWEYRSAPDSKNQGILVYGTTISGYITWRRFRAPNYVTGATYQVMAGGTHPWVQLKSNPRSVGGDVKVLGIVLTDTIFDIGAIKWNGTAFTVIGTNTISSDTTVATYECFEFEFSFFGMPIEFASEAEFAGASSTETWIQLTWTIDGSSTTADANATFQLYNYQTGQYPTSEDGYMTATIGTDDITMSQNITTDPTRFRDDYGNWTMKIRIVKTTSEQFDWRCDLVKFTSTHPTEFTCEVEFTGTANTLNWTQFTWMVDSALSTGNVNVTWQLYNYTAGNYSTSGDGYLSYISNPIAGTVETYNQTITEYITDFRDSDGNWRIKIRGVKAVDTELQFDFNVDLVELSTEPVRHYRLLASNTFSIDLSAYPPNHIRGIQISIRYNVTEDTEKWFLEAYNWTASSFSHVGFNDTDGHQPTRNSWNEFTVSVTDDWADYMQGNSMMIEFHDEGLPANQTVAEIDFLGVTPLIDGVRLELRNMGSLTTHVVSLWVIDSTSHQRYDANFFLNLGEEKTYVNMDVILPEGNFVVKVVTERGNIAVASGS